MQQLNQPSAAIDRGAVTVVILAGGAGTRIAHVLGDIPKPMAVVNGRPFIDWIVRWLTRQGFQQFRISTGHRAEVIENHFRTTSCPGAAIRCIREESPLGTAGGFLRAIEDVRPPDGGYLVVNGDSLLLADPGKLLTAGWSNSWEAGLFGVRVADARRYGAVEVDGAGMLHRFEEKTGDRGLINAGVYWFAARGLARWPREVPLSFERDVFPALLRVGAPVGVVPVEAPFIDIGTPASLSEAGAFIAKQMAQCVNPFEEAI